MAIYMLWKESLKGDGKQVHFEIFVVQSGWSQKRKLPISKPFLLTNDAVKHMIYMLENNLIWNSYFFQIESNIRVSEWVSDCCLTPIQQFFAVYHAVKKLIFNEMMMRSALQHPNTLSWICTVLAHRNNSPRVNMSLHWDTCVSSPKQQSTGKHVAPLGHIIVNTSQPVFHLSP